MGESFVAFQSKMCTVVSFVGLGAGAEAAVGVAAEVALGRQDHQDHTTPYSPRPATLGAGEGVAEAGEEVGYFFFYCILLNMI